MTRQTVYALGVFAAGLLGFLLCDPPVPREEPRGEMVRMVRSLDKDAPRNSFPDVTLKGR